MQLNALSILCAKHNALQTAIHDKRLIHDLEKRCYQVLILTYFIIEKSQTREIIRTTKMGNVSNKLFRCSSNNVIKFPAFESVSRMQCKIHNI